MKRSVSRKLFLTLCGITALFVFFSYALNTLFLEKVYVRTKETALLRIFENIENNYSGDMDALSARLETDENLQQVRILIADADYKIIYSSPVSFRSMAEYRNFGGQAYGLLRGKMSNYTKNPTIEESNDSRLNSTFINLYGKITADGTPVYVRISTPVASISGSAAVANQFYLFTGIVTLLIGSIIIFLVSRKITKPVLEINRAARSLSNLEFSHKIRVRSKDELGQLGESINLLSEKLEKSITSLQQANAQLLEDMKEKDKIDDMRKEFVSNVSHELKTPISLIMGYAEGLKVNVNEKEKDFYCDIISDEAQKMNKLVMNLLDLAQLESGFIRPEKRTFDMAGLVGRYLEKNRILLEEGKADVRVSMEGRCFVNADYDLMEQVFNNIATNALNHMDGRKKMAVAVEKKADKVRVSVWNSGSGIPEESLDKIWDSFYKVDKARTRAYGGFGLGLKIVKTIMEAHHNSCGARNENGGVLFWFEADRAGG